MADLTQLTPAQDLLDQSGGTQIGALTLSEPPVAQIWSIAPYPGREASLASLLPAGFPAPNQVVSGGGLARLVWSGRAQAFWIGDTAPAPGLAQQAALVDQSDAWCVLHLDGRGAQDVLARLCPLDLAPALFGVGQTARSLLGHMTAQITGRPEGFELMVFRSMAQTAVHEMTDAMRHVAARRDLSISG